MNGRAETASAAAADPDSRSVPLAEVLGRAGDELAQLAWLLEHLQMLIRPLLQEAAQRDETILRHAQSFDHIGQKAAGLAGFLAALSLAAPPEWRVDPAPAAKIVPLAALSSRLGFADDADDSRSDGRGDCEFF